MCCTSKIGSLALVWLAFLVIQLLRGSKTTKVTTIFYLIFTTPFVFAEERFLKEGHLELLMPFITYHFLS